MAYAPERLGLYALAVLLPLERLGAFAVGGTNVRPSQLALLATLFFVMRRWLHRPKEFDWRRTEYLLLVVFLAVSALSLTNAENFGRSAVVLAFTVFTLSLAFVMPMVLRRKKDLFIVRNILIVSAGAVSLFGLWQFAADMAGLPAALTGLRPQYTKAILGFTRVQSTALEPLYFANYLLLPVALAMTWLIEGAGRRRVALAGLLALMLTNIFLTSSRGGYGALLVTLGVILWSYRKRNEALRKLFALGVASLVIGFVLLRAIASFEVTTPGTLADTFIGHVTNLTSGAAVEERLETFERAIDAWRTHPWLGVGVGGYGPFSAVYPDTEPAVGWAIVNNEPLELLAETGILGLAAILGFLLYILRLGLRARDDELEPLRIAMLAAVIGIIVQYQTFSTLYIMHIWFAIGLLLTLSRFKTRQLA